MLATKYEAQTHLMKESRENKDHELRCQLVAAKTHKRIVNVSACTDSSLSTCIEIFDKIKFGKLLARHKILKFYNKILRWALANILYIVHGCTNLFL